MDQRPLDAFVADDPHGALGGVPGETPKHAAFAAINHRRMDDETGDGGLSRTSCRCGTIQSKAGSGENGRSSVATCVAGRPEQPASARVDETSPFRLRGQVGHQRVKQMPVARRHVDPKSHAMWMTPSTSGNVGSQA